MSKKIRLLLITIVCLILSLLASFFVVFNAVFSDVFGAIERIGTYVYAGVVYLVLGLVFGLIGASHPRLWVASFSIPPIVILFLYTFSEPQNVLIHLGFAILVPLATYAGVRVGAALRTKKPILSPLLKK